MFRKKVTKQASAVVTGAGSGIGRAFALEIAKRGGRVVCSDINLAAAEETVSLINAAGGQALAVKCDVSGLASVENLAVESEHWFGGPADLVVNNAGVGIGGRPIGEIPIEDWQWTVGVNLWGVVHGCHVFAPRLRALGRGGIINVCSTASFAAAPLMGPYNVTKAAVLALSETLKAELAGTGVNVTALCPTFVKTNIVRDGRIPAGTSKMGSKLMEWTGVSPESVAITTLDALDRNQLYVLPQFDARMVWRLKRFAPVSYNRGSGIIGRLMARGAAT
ncbi:MAG: SDR family NAD(P)-dependent oxidoreductase [Moraxellaceae bacterium]|nr:SDR family NAD(P)-dependent oxidoreductase [Moraxellaceae bacterium]